MSKMLNEMTAPQLLEACEAAYTQRLLSSDDMYPAIDDKSNCTGRQWLHWELPEPRPYPFISPLEIKVAELDEMNPLFLHFLSNADDWGRLMRVIKIMQPDGSKGALHFLE
jgi:hypothetical protein